MVKVANFQMVEDREVPISLRSRAFQKSAWRKMMAPGTLERPERSFLAEDDTVAGDKATKMIQFRLVSDIGPIVLVLTLC